MQRAHMYATAEMRLDITTHRHVPVSSEFSTTLSDMINFTLSKSFLFNATTCTSNGPTSVMVGVPYKIPEDELFRW